MSTIITFAIALGALVLFFAYKVLERSRSFPRYQRIRSRADALVVRWGTAVEARIRYVEDKVSLHGVVRDLAHTGAHGVAYAARTVEQRALAATRRLSRNGHRQGTESRSPFLHEVSSHKSSLDTDRVKRETSLADADTASE